MNAMTVSATLRDLKVAFTREELDEINRLAIYRMKNLSAQAAWTFRPGQRVTFPGRGGFTVAGVVEQTNRTTVTVKADGGMKWRVSGSLLKAA